MYTTGAAHMELPGHAAVSKRAPPEPELEQFRLGKTLAVVGLCRELGEFGLKLS